MNIFISYPSSHKDLAESTALALRRRRHALFTDRRGLVPGEEFNVRIKEEIDKTDLFIFFITPDALQQGRYTMTELGYARERWPDAHGHILPVMVEATPMEQVPSYLKSVTILEPKGNVPAEIAATVDKLAPWSPHRIARVAIPIAIPVAAALVAAWVFTPTARAPEPVQTTAQTQAATTAATQQVQQRASEDYSRMQSHLAQYQKYKDKGDEYFAEKNWHGGETMYSKAMEYAQLAHPLEGLTRRGMLLATMSFYAHNRGDHALACQFLAESERATARAMGSLQQLLPPTVPFHEVSNLRQTLQAQNAEKYRAAEKMKCLPIGGAQ